LSDPKAAEILDACRWKDIGRLRSLAEARGGFLSDVLRRQACMSVLFPAPATAYLVSVLHTYTTSTRAHIARSRCPF
jgi:hypothetical protein